MRASHKSLFSFSIMSRFLVRCALGTVHRSPLSSPYQSVISSPFASTLLKDATADMFSSKPNMHDAAKVVVQRGKFWDAAKADAAIKGDTADPCLTQAREKAAQFFKINELCGASPANRRGVWRRDRGKQSELGGDAANHG